MGIQERDYYTDEPVGLHLNLQAQSVVTKLIFINVAVFMVNFFTSTAENPNWLMWSLSTTPQDLASPLRWWTVLTAGFAHDPTSLRHILSNMLGLFFLGKDVEDRMGSREFLAFYLGTIVLSGLASLLRYWFFVPSTEWPRMLGASGAVVAVICSLVVELRVWALA